MSKYELSERQIAGWRSHVDFEHPTGCHLWRGHVHRSGYGMYGGRWAHRVAVVLERGPIPNGMAVDHLCRVPLCVNPAHLEVVTQQVNVLRGVSSGAIACRQNACMQGHEFTPENTYVRPDGRGRNCRACATRRRREAAAARADERKIAEAIRLTEADDADCLWDELEFEASVLADIDHLPGGAA